MWGMSYSADGLVPETKNRGVEMPWGYLPLRLGVLGVLVASTRTAGGRNNSPNQESHHSNTSNEHKSNADSLAEARQDKAHNKPEHKGQETPKQSANGSIPPMDQSVKRQCRPTTELIIPAAGTDNQCEEDEVNYF